jgi:hypothetical protein
VASDWRKPFVRTKAAWRYRFPPQSMRQLDLRRIMGSKREILCFGKFSPQPHGKTKAEFCS